MDLPANAKWNNAYRKVEGKSFGNWTVLEYGGLDSRKNALAICQCICGTKRPVIAGHLARGESLSGGCTAAVTHGMSGTPEHETWKSIKQRTTNVKRKDYARYGGAGVKMCKE